MRFDAAVLSRALKTESEALTAIVALLREEQQALVHGETERLASFAASKAAYLVELTRLGEQRVHWLRESGLTIDRAGMERLLRGLGDSAPPATAAWRQLLDMMKTAQHLNEVNGALIGSRLNGTQRALSILFSAANIAGAYTADGSTVCLRTAHELAVA